jgi:hypothetical protein
LNFRPAGVPDREKQLPVRHFESLSEIQHDQPACMEFRLYFGGETVCADRVSRFCVAPAGAKGDFPLYCQYETTYPVSSNTSIQRLGQ